MFASSFDGVGIHYETEGDPEKEPLLFSNSLGTNLHMWEPQIPALRERFHIIRYDARGHGKSSAPGGDYTIEMLARDALAVIDAAGHTRASFCGLSMGGMVGIWLGANAPEVIDRMVIANTGAYLGPRDLWDTRIATAREKGMEALIPSVLERWFTKGFREQHPKAVEAVAAMLRTTPPEGYASSCAAIRDMDQRDLLQRIEMPTLVIAGRHDPATPPAKAEEIAAGVPNARLAVLDTAHLSNIEHPAAFAEALIEFLAPAGAPSIR